MEDDFSVILFVAEDDDEEKQRIYAVFSEKNT